MLPAGHQLGPYVLVSPLGAGGMGEVYLAEDSRLGRRVALKVLPSDLTADERARKRLIREARAVAKLDHPNICTIYEAGEVDGHSYIAMQYVEGQTLAQRVLRKPLELAEIVPLAHEVAQALAEAHRHGIVHRDIKPQNIMISRQGRAIVLDFGLAQPTAPVANDANTASVLTETGAVAGTVPYMSPEQVRGDLTDERSDIFSFGTMIYEALSRAHPFAGASTADTISSILTRDPQSLDPSVPQELRRIVHKCLEKDRDRRYQSARDLVVDLGVISRETGTPSPPPAPVRTRSRVAWMTTAALAMVAAIVTVAYVWKTRENRTTAPEYVQVTSFADSATAPSLSPDGRMVAFIRGGPPFMSRGDIYVKLLPNGEALRLTNDRRPKYAPVFTPDGARVAYTLIEQAGSAMGWSTWTVPVFGGEPTRLLPNASGLTWIDDRRVLFSEIKGGAGLHMGIVTATEARADSRVIYFPSHERGMAHYSSLSPDQQWLLIVEMNRTGGWEQCRVLPFDGSSTGRQVGPPGECRAAAWSPDGHWMYFSVEVAGASHLWRQRFPTGAPEPLTSGPATDEQGVAVAPDGRSLITSIGRRGSSLWLDEPGGERLLSGEGFASAPRLSADGRRVYCLLQRDATSSAFDLAVLDLATGRTERLLADFAIVQYSVSPDETEVAFTTAEINGERHIWIARLDRRSAPRRLATAADQVHFAGKTLVFRSLEGHANFIDRIDRDGAGRARIVETPILQMFAGSPDGQWAVVLRSVPNEESTAATLALSIQGGTAKQLCTALCITAWSPDARLLALSFPLRGRTLVVPLATGQSFPDFPQEGEAAQSWANLSGARWIEQGSIAPGHDPSTYVFVKQDEFRNLFRIPIR